MAGGNTTRMGRFELNKVRYGVVGVGSMGRNHVRAAHELEQAELVGIADSNAANAAEIAARYGCEAFPDAVSMIEACRPDAVSICVPTTWHYRVARDCMLKGVHVLVEKPIAATVDEGEKLLALAKSQGVKLMVGHIERFNPAIRKVKEIIGKGEIGKIVSIAARRVGVFPPQIKDANIAVDLAIHDIDIVNFLLGGTATKVAAVKSRNHIESRDDSVEILMKCGETSAYIQANWITPVKIRKLSITGTDGYLEMDYINQKIQLFQSNYEKYRDTPGQRGGYADYVLKYLDPDIIEYNVAKKEPLKEELQYFLRMISDPDAQIDARHAIDALAIALEC